MKTQNLLSYQLSCNMWQYSFIMSFLLGESHAQRSLVDCSPSLTESDTTKRLSMHACTHTRLTSLLLKYLPKLEVYTFGCLLFNSPFPDPSASGNHKFDLFFYKFVCFQSIIDLQCYISFCYIT